MSVNHLTVVERPQDTDIMNLGVSWGSEYKSFVVEINTTNCPVYITESELIKCLYLMDKLKEIRKEMSDD